MSKFKDNFPTLYPIFKALTKVLKISVMILVLIFLASYILNAPKRDLARQREECRQNGYQGDCKTKEIWECHVGWNDYHCHTFEESNEGCNESSDPDACLYASHIH